MTLGPRGVARDGGDWGPARTALDSPPATLARATVLLLVAALVTAVCYLSWARIDVMVVARGTIIPAGGTLIVRSVEAGTLTSVLASPGDQLEAGAALVELTVIEPGGEARLVEVVLPVAATVLLLHVGSIGSHLEPDRLVATVIPEGKPYVIRAKVLNREVGRVTPGARAQIRVDAFPFQRFGTVTARVLRVFPNAGGEEDFTVVLELEEKRLPGGQRLFHGLAVEAEILAGRERLLDRVLGSGFGGGRG